MPPETLDEVFLQIRRGDDVVRVPLGPKPLILGRGGDSQLRLSDTLVSREHARIVRALDGTVLVADLGSRNGTFIQERRIGPFDGPAPLAPGEVARIGTTSISISQDDPADLAEATLSLPQPPSPPSPPPAAAAEEPPTLPAAPSLGRRSPSGSTIVLPLDPGEMRSTLSRRRGDDDLLALLWNAGDALNRETTPRGLLEAVRGFLAGALAPARVVVLESRPASRRTWRSIDPAGPIPSMTVVARALAARAAVLVRVASDDHEIARAGSVRIGGLTSAIAAPVLCRGEPLAVLYADRRDEPFTERELGIAGVIAAHAAAALDGAFLRAELEAKVVERTAQVRRQADELARLGEEKDEILGMAAHDIRSPLSGVLGLVDMLRADCAAANAGEAVDASLALAGETVRRVLDLVSDLLDVKKIEAGKIAIERAPVEAADVLREGIGIAHAVARRKGIELVVEAPRDLVAVVDARRLAQAVQNLVSNAVKFTRKGGRVKVTARRAGADLEVAVEDSGPGIAPEDLPRIFDRFEVGEAGRRMRGGYGLGLAIARKLVELHGGRMGVESEVGRGSRFAFRVPAAAAGAGAPAAA